MDFAPWRACATGLPPNSFPPLRVPGYRTIPRACGTANPASDRVGDAIAIALQRPSSGFPQASGHERRAPPSGPMSRRMRPLRLHSSLSAPQRRSRGAIARCRGGCPPPYSSRLIVLTGKSASGLPNPGRADLRKLGSLVPDHGLHAESAALVLSRRFLPELAALQTIRYPFVR